MSARPVIVSLLVLALLLVPALGLAADDLSAPPAGKHHTGRVHHQPDRVWRSTPSTLAPAVSIPAATRAEGITLAETILAAPLLVRAPFVPPRA
jgi:hypothetical protein